MSILQEIRLMQAEYFNLHGEMPTILNLSHNDRLRLKCVTQLLPIEDIEFNFRIYDMDVLPSTLSVSTVE